MINSPIWETCDITFEVKPSANAQELHADGSERLYDGSEMCSDPQALQGATVATALNGDQQLVLLLAPSGFTEAFACPLGGTNPGYNLYLANPPAGG